MARDERPGSRGARRRRRATRTTADADGAAQRGTVERLGAAAPAPARARAARDEAAPQTAALERCATQLARDERRHRADPLGRELARALRAASGGQRAAGRRAARSLEPPGEEACSATPLDASPRPTRISRSARSVSATASPPVSHGGRASAALDRAARERLLRSRRRNAERREIARARARAPPSSPASSRSARHLERSDRRLRAAARGPPGPGRPCAPDALTAGAAYDHVSVSASPPARGRRAARRGSRCFGRTWKVSRQPPSSGSSPRAGRAARRRPSPPSRP